MLTMMLALAACGADAADTSDLGEPDAPVPHGLEAGCPPEDTRLRLAKGELPEGAVGVRLCPGAPITAYDGAQVGSSIQGPVDELTADVTSLVDLVNGLPEFAADTGCHFDAGPNLVYWFRYPDGDARAVSYGEYGCHTVVAGEGRVRQHGARLATAFAEALLLQRSQSSPPVRGSGGAPGPACPMPPDSAPVSVLPQVPLTLTHATWCQGVGPYRMRAAPIPAGLLRRLNESLVGEPTERRDRCRSGGYSRSIEGVTAWGDRVSFPVSGCRAYVRTGYGRDQAFGAFTVDRPLVAALEALRLGPVQRWEK